VATAVSCDAPEHVPEAVELALYFVACEALANIGKYADATSASVQVSRTAIGLAIEIADGGVGGADPANGSGLVGRRAAGPGAEHEPDVAIIDIRMLPTFTDGSRARRTSSAPATPGSGSWRAHHLRAHRHGSVVREWCPVSAAHRLDQRARDQPARRPGRAPESAPENLPRPRIVGRTAASTA
jgi:hypothetical protein